jgi:ribonuclease E
VNTGKFVGSGGNLEETVTKNNLEAAEEIVRQLRLRDIGGIVVVDFIDMVLESNRDLVLRRLVECLSRDRTKHQVAEVTSLGLVQMTRKKLGLGLLETFSEPCEVCAGRGVIVHHDPVVKHRAQQPERGSERRRGRGNGGSQNGGGNSGGNGGSNGSASGSAAHAHEGTHQLTEEARNSLARIAASTLAHPATGSTPVIEVDAAATAADQAEPVAEQTPEAPAEQSPRSGGRRSRSRRARSTGGEATDAPAEELAASVTKESATPVITLPAAAAAEESATPVIELPASHEPAERPIDREKAAQLLDSVLEALPPAPAPRQGRRSRRVTTAALTTDARADGAADSAAVDGTDA